MLPALPGRPRGDQQEVVLLPEGPHAKSYGVLAPGDRLYAFPGSLTQGYKEARLYAAPPGSNSWRRVGWAFTKHGPGRLLSPAFLQAGRGHAYAARP